MMRKKIAIVWIGVALLLAVLFFLPMIPESPWVFECAPQSSCPGGGLPNQAQYAARVSVTQYYLGVGGRLLFGWRYQIAYLLGWTCYQTSTEVTVTSTNGSATTTKTTSMSGAECIDHVIVVS